MTAPLIMVHCKDRLLNLRQPSLRCMTERQCHRTAPVTYGLLLTARAL